MSEGCRRRRWCLAVLAALTVCLAGAAPVQAAPFAYVLDSTSGVWQYDATAGALSPLTPATVGGGGNGVAVSPDARSVYVTGSDAVAQYDAGLDGKLTPKIPATVASAAARGVVVSPDGKSVYVINDSGSGVVSQYDVGAGGTLSPKTPATVAAGGSPSALAVSPDGKSVYVASHGNQSSSGAVFQYDVGAGGLLSAKTPASVPADSGANALAVSPDGRTVYVVADSSSPTCRSSTSARGVG